jgi:hypothetical protein
MPIASVFAPPPPMPVQQPEIPLNMMGYLPGQLALNPKLAPPVTAGAARPFAPGEYMKNPDGSWSSEMSYTVAHPALNGGKPTNIPGLWIKDGKPYHATEDEAAQFASQSGLLWPTYNKIDEADAAASEREKDWQKMSPEQAVGTRPLYVVPPSIGQGIK